jgi:hypothetical protein
MCDVLQVSLAVADCVVLISSVPNEILSYYLIGEFYFHWSLALAHCIIHLIERIKTIDVGDWHSQWGLPVAGDLVRAAQIVSMYLPNQT